jgi:hypothetical protein
MKYNQNGTVIIVKLGVVMQGFAGTLNSSCLDHRGRT